VKALTAQFIVLALKGWKILRFPDTRGKKSRWVGGVEGVG
jgi:hypothetical protein